MSLALVACAMIGCSGDADESNGQDELPACLAPGDYLLSWTTISDTCGGVELPPELFTIRSDGAAAGSADPPDGCTDGPITDVNCVRDFQRQCRLPVAQGAYLDADYNYVFDLLDGTASVRIDARGYENGALQVACVAVGRGAISAL